MDSNWSLSLPPTLHLFWDWDLNSGICTCKAGTLLLELHLQLILLWLFWRWGLMNYLPGLASNHNPPNLSLSKYLGLQVWATGTWLIIPLKSQFIGSCQSLLTMCFLVCLSIYLLITGLGKEPRASYMLGKRSTMSYIPSNPLSIIL
jgi:hypothetical protein